MECFTFPIDHESKTFNQMLKKIALFSFLLFLCNIVYSLDSVHEKAEHIARTSILHAYEKCLNSQMATSRETTEKCVRSVFQKHVNLSLRELFPQCITSDFKIIRDGSCDYITLYYIDLVKKRSMEEIKFYTSFASEHLQRKEIL